MTTATVRDLRNHFSELSKKLEAGETVQILKRGKPYAKLILNGSERTSFVGAGQGLGTVPDDFDEPLDLEWEALK